MKLIQREIIIWIVFTVLGPPMGAFTYITFEQWILPTPSVLGFYEPSSLTEAIQHYAGNLLIAALLSYFMSPLFLLCAFALSIIKIWTRPSVDTFVAALTGLTIATLCVIPLWASKTTQLGYPKREAIDLTLSYVVSTYCCGWLTKRRLIS